MIYKNIELHGIKELLPDDRGGVRLCRVPQSLLPALSELGRDVSENVIGGELRFVPLDGEVKITLSTAYPDAVNRALVYYGSVQSGWETLGVTIDNTPRTFTFRPSPRLETLKRVTEENRFPFAPQVIRVLLHTSPVVLHSVEGVCRPPLPEEVPAKKGIFYGSSITHGSLACAPNLFWTRRTAEALHCDQENYGFAGSCRMEAPLVDWFAARDDWDFFVAEMGINVLAAYDGDTYRTRVRYLLETIHAAHPEKYLFCIDVFYCSDDLHGGEKSALFRKILAEEVARFASDRVVHIPGLSVFPDARGLSEDTVHPSVDGVNTIAENLTTALRSYLRVY